ncbi:RHS repeat-associated core domain-containing protein [Pseudomonas syringae pv. syringae]|uniref:Teneurin-like YD-shell domain-containing protein n=5 Tax=Pseudomonas syringae TaxID=317 RepID=A0A0P9IIE4_PSESX|nr:MULTISPECIES: RHS repeat-associated core domain-containing protein [Pseudomonas]KPW08924.1 Uncharacterized protein ALO91_01713 [Pseudomonas syringae pv. aceris]KPY55798.1 Uncharacterized protein ALO46_01021 [Pseudomonas syringae pv. solidagae]KTB77268.1 hypothetical protein AO069_21110 [Pseudomonas syringae pv. syringae PD2774]KWS23622.1 hypothetical protein AL061_21325 [Pseudomonas syringae pv. syringae]MCH5515410.1 RHS repeat-associated core domain-containing protein [Pseudomonas syringae
MTSSNQAVLCRYSYDPLDRLASSSPAGQADVQRFYQKNRLATEIEGASRRTVFQHEDLLLAQQRRVEGAIETTLLATDQQRSVLQLVDKAGTESMAYSPYGHHPAESGLTSLLGFNGERRDPVTGHYLLGNGYRAYNPVLMRFNSPDSLSPFDEGGLNAYGYCGGDPVGVVDPSGHITIVAIRAISKVGFLSFRKARIRSRPITSKVKHLISQNVQTSIVSHTGTIPVSLSSSAGISTRPMGPAHAALAPYSAVGVELTVVPRAGIIEKMSDPSYLSRMRSWVDRKASPVVSPEFRAASKRLELHKRKVEGASILYDFYKEKTKSGRRIKMYSASKTRYEKTLNEYRDVLKGYKEEYNIAHASEIRDM